mmetsp:Transcript_41855/g.87485  ORF Transcript_41855/g.87485 Transcript_41855/m.87485 type:complete len:85 (-) Transcript_41855:19-273(-)
MRRKVTLHNQHKRSNNQKIMLNRIIRYNGRRWFDSRTCENKKRENRQMNITNRTDLDISRNNPAIPDFLCSKCCDHKVEGDKMC